MDGKMTFENRTEAGKELVLKLLDYKTERVVVLALPRGGVPVGYEIARVLKMPLDTLVARKIGAPSNPEFAVGAIAPGNVVILDDVSIQFLGLKNGEIDKLIKEEMKEMDRRMVFYKSGEYRKNSPIETVIIVDDGLATGLSAQAAIESVKATLKPRKIIFAAPICARETADKLRGLANEVVCVGEVENLTAISLWYKKFDQTTDEEVINYLEKANKRSVI